MGPTPQKCRMTNAQLRQQLHPHNFTHLQRLALSSEEAYQRMTVQAKAVRMQSLQRISYQRTHKHFAMNRQRSQYTAMQLTSPQMGQAATDSHRTSSVGHQWPTGLSTTHRECQLDGTQCTGATWSPEAPEDIEHRVRGFTAEKTKWMRNRTTTKT